MTKRRTFHSFLGNMFPKFNMFDYNSLPSLNSNKNLLQLCIIPFFSIFLFCSNWIKRTGSKKYYNIKYKYLFLKSKKIKSKKHSLNIIPKLIFILKIIALHNFPTTPNKFLPSDYYPNENFQSLRFTQTELSHCKINEEYFVAYALSKLTFRNQKYFFTHFLFLCGDIELNPGPIRQFCSVCDGVVNKRSLFCSICNTAVHKKCEKSKISQDIFLCESCRPGPDLGELPFHKLSFLEDINNQTNITAIKDTSDNENIWKFSENKGLHFIHFNINSLLDKIDQLRLQKKINPQ